MLLDVLMPVMDGWRCAREMRTRYGDSLPIVVVTAAELGADDFLAKPFEMRDLLEIVTRYGAQGCARAD